MPRLKIPRATFKPHSHQTQPATPNRPRVGPPQEIGARRIQSAQYLVSIAAIYIGGVSHAEVFTGDREKPWISFQSRRDEIFIARSLWRICKLPRSVMCRPVPRDRKKHCAPTELCLPSWLSGYKHFAATRPGTISD